MNRRKAVFILVFMLLPFFLIGGLIAFFGIITVEIYATLAGVLGGVASVIGLISIASPSLTTSDVRAVEYRPRAGRDASQDPRTPPPLRRTR